MLVSLQQYVDRIEKLSSGQFQYFPCVIIIINNNHVTTNTLPRKTEPYKHRTSQVK